MAISKSIFPKLPLILLAAAFIFSLSLKIINIKVGAPFVTIDDNTTFEGGFLVWFGNVPPQRMYLESWVAGTVSLLTFMAKSVAGGQGFSVVNLNMLADAYRDYYSLPDPYVLSYRWVMLVIDMVTGWFVYLLAKQVLRDRWQGFASAVVAVMYLFSYNTVWSNVVARPDTLVAIFGVTGIYFYYRSGFGDDDLSFFGSAALLGCAAGMKLHGAFFVIFIVIDLIRVHGFSLGLRRAIFLIFISFLIFGIAAGIPFFDPLKYVKLRMLNYQDDLSPWITWYDHFVTILRGSGWVIVPLVLLAGWRVFKNPLSLEDQRIKSVIFLSLCWLLLFSVIRALRAYWMLPALPLFYISAIYALATLQQPILGKTVAAMVIGLMIIQTFHEFWQFRGVDYNGIRRWVVENVSSEEPIYIYGFEALNLPKTTHSIRQIRLGLERIIEEDLQEGLPFTLRHVKNWEERSTLARFDMLEYRFDGGHTYYGFHSSPLDKFKGIIDLDEMQYIFVQDHFSMDRAPGLADYLEDRFSFLTELTGPGGGGRGLSYRIYKRIAVE